MEQKLLYLDAYEPIVVVHDIKKPTKLQTLMDKVYETLGKIHVIIACHAVKSLVLEIHGEKCTLTTLEKAKDKLTKTGKAAIAILLTLLDFVINRFVLTTLGTIIAKLTGKKNKDEIFGALQLPPDTSKGLFKCVKKELKKPAYWLIGLAPAFITEEVSKTIAAKLGILKYYLTAFNIVEAFTYIDTGWKRIWSHLIQDIAIKTGIDDYSLVHTLEELFKDPYISNLYKRLRHIVSQSARQEKVKEVLEVINRKHIVLSFSKLKEKVQALDEELAKTYKMLLVGRTSVVLFHFILGYLHKIGLNWLASIVHFVNNAILTAVFKCYAAQKGMAV